MWTTIAYRDAMENNQAVRLYDDSTEKSFELYDDAIAYAAYLTQKFNTGVDTYEKTSIPPGGLDIDELKRQDALAKLTEEEKTLLNINP